MRQHDIDKVTTNDDLLNTDTNLTDKHLKVGKDSNPDPITKEPGSHPVGTGLGASGGGLAGAAIGTAVGGPIGGIVGGAIGAISGGLAGHGVAITVTSVWMADRSIVVDRTPTCSVTWARAPPPPAGPLL